MPTTALDVVPIATRYPSTAATEFAFVAGDDANGNHIPGFTGRELILVQNTSVDTAFTLTITSTPDALGRLQNYAESIPFGELRAIALAVKGWRQTDRTILLQVEDPALVVAVLRLPN